MARELGRLLNRVSCKGSKPSPFSCRHGRLVNYYCRRREDAIVRCGNIGGENN